MKRQFVTVIVLAMGFLLMLPLVAKAQGKKLNYIEFRPGVYSPTGDLDDYDFDTTYNLELAFGHYFTPNFALEASVGYFDTDTSDRGTDALLGSWKEDDEVWAIPVALTGKVVLPGDRWELYGGAGVALYFAHYEADFRSDLIDFDFEDDDTVFGGHVVAGFNSFLTDVVFIGFEGKYMMTEEGKATDTILGYPFSVKGNLNGYTITFKIGYRF